MYFLTHPIHIFNSHSRYGNDIRLANEELSHGGLNLLHKHIGFLVCFHIWIIVSSADVVVVVCSIEYFYLRNNYNFRSARVFAAKFNCDLRYRLNKLREFDATYCTYTHTHARALLQSKIPILIARLETVYLKLVRFCQTRLC